MTVVTLRPTGAAERFPYAAGEVIFEVPPSVVGSPPQLGDSSDATYAVSEYVAGTSRSTIGVQFPATRFSAIASATLYVREASTTSTSATPRWVWSMYAPGGEPFSLVDYFRLQFEYYDTARSAEYPGHAEGSVGEWAIPLVPDYTNLLGPLADGLWLELQSGERGFSESAFDSTLTVYDVWLVIDGTTDIPPLRQHPRGDALGLSGARRAFGNRSQQASIRRAGGFL